jgi:hypothetical protein
MRSVSLGCDHSLEYNWLFVLLYCVIVHSCHSDRGGTHHIRTFICPSVRKATSRKGGCTDRGKYGQMDSTSICDEMKGLGSLRGRYPNRKTSCITNQARVLSGQSNEGTNQPTDGPTNGVSYKTACSRLKFQLNFCKIKIKHANIVNRSEMSTYNIFQYTV